MFAAPTFPPPRPTGDRERDALARGFWGCRVLARRLAPLATGKAVFRVHLGSEGEILAITVWSEGLAEPVVRCLTAAVRATRFDPRGGDGSELAIPVDFTSPDGTRPEVLQPPGNVSM